MRYLLILAFLNSAGCSIDTGSENLSFEKAEDVLFKIRDQNIKLPWRKGKTRKDVRKEISQDPQNVTIISPPKKTKTNEKKVRQMVFMRYDKYIFAAKNGNKKTVFVEYVRLKQNERELDSDAKDFPDDQWNFINFYVTSKVPERFSRLTRKDGKPIPDSMKNPGDAPIAAGGGKPKKGDDKTDKGKPAKKIQNRPTAADIMKRSDKNNDGKLTGKEIPEEMKRFMDALDSNKDGSVSKAELESLIEKGKSPRQRKQK